MDFIALDGNIKKQSRQIKLSGGAFTIQSIHENLSQ